MNQKEEKGVEQARRLAMALELVRSMEGLAIGLEASHATRNRAFLDAVEREKKLAKADRAFWEQREEGGRLI